eukprot:CAMPEP_0182899818 /NCGR_PEP_ID=MMETSP0034_2-20130328/28326_1 /TAXON_ID=156128 /ORGANISM="Nephroselmis pyriformis, Strain CCMP717" /LENGTH=106 /DNA_ID=CAMNT_0025033887 /DNA_START=492 /DNA_END=812 /DNA_ORIENTATION=-
MPVGHRAVLVTLVHSYTPLGGRGERQQFVPGHRLHALCHHVRATVEDEVVPIHLPALDTSSPVVGAAGRSDRGLEATWGLGLGRVRMVDADVLIELPGRHPLVPGA